MAVYNKGPGGGTAVTGNPVVGPGGKCLDVAGDDTGGNGTPVRLWDCQSWARDQHWSLRNGQLQTLGRCLDVINQGTASGSRLQLWDCQDSARDQNWAWSGSSLTTLGMCLDVAGGGTANGTPLQLHNCTGNPAQVWVANANGTLTNPQSGRCVDSPNGATGNGTRLQIWDCNGSGAQTFAKA